MLDDDKYFFLADSAFHKGDAKPDEATLVKGIRKKWYPCDKDYGLGCTGPMMYMTPYDPTNTGNYTEAEAADLVYKDITFGRANWAPNWDPGYQSWLIPEDDPYMDSWMEFDMSAAGGCQAKMYRGESGTKGASTGTTKSGDDVKYNITNVDLSVGTTPYITFDNCYAMHNLNMDGACSNWTQDIIVAELTPYYMALVTKRTNSEGNWYLVWNFVSEEVKKTDGACIPKDESGLIEKNEPVLPEFNNAAEDMFTVENNGVTYIGNGVTYTVDTDAPYDWLWWDGSPNVNAWKELTGGEYNSTWAPMPNDVEDELVLTKNSDGTYSYEFGNYSGDMTISGNKVTFSNGIKFVTAENSSRSVAVEGKEFTILKQSAAEGMTIGVPASKNENGNVDSYLCVNLLTKAIGGGETGPTVIALTDDYDSSSWIENNALRLAFYHYGGSGIFKDPNNVKFKKGQTLTVKFTLNPDLEWENTPKCALIDNQSKKAWETSNPSCFEDADAVTVNTKGETTVTITNTTGSTYKFTNECLDLSIQLQGYIKNYDAEMSVSGMFQKVSCTIE